MDKTGLMRRSVPAASPWAKDYGYVRAVQAGPLVEVGGTTAIAPDGTVIAPGDPYEQTLAALAIIDRALGDLGLDRSTIVRTRVFMREITDWRDAGRAHREFFEGHDFPTSSCIGGCEFLSPDLVVEIEATAWAG
jgi:enamine deaminase RidA (YjgF/YER057c/UK114 family)